MASHGTRPLTWREFWDVAHDIWKTANMFRVGKHTPMSRKLFWTSENGEKRVCYLVFCVQPDRRLTAEIDDPLCALEGEFHTLAHSLAARITNTRRFLKDDQEYRNLTMGERARFVQDGERKRYAQSWYKQTPFGLTDVRLRFDNGFWYLEPVTKRGFEYFDAAHKLPPGDDVPEIVRPAALFRTLRRLRRDKINYDPTPLSGPECERLRQEEEAEWAQIVAFHESQGRPAPM